MKIMELSGEIGTRANNFALTEEGMIFAVADCKIRDMKGGMRITAG